MKNKKSIERVISTEIVKSITCNKCGNTYEPDIENEYPYIHSVDISFNEERSRYHSKCWWFDLCDKCLVDFVKTFKYAPEWFMGGIGESSQRKFEEWKNGAKIF